MRDNLDDSEILKDLEYRLAKQVDRAENAERVLSELEVASTNFALGVLEHLSQLPKKEFDTLLPKKEFEALLPVLTEARNLVKKPD